jgi:uncharacterized protein YndB with AHSA1/START domain
VPAWAGDELGISHTCAAIHQEVVFKASPKRVYEALIDAKQFSKVIALSAAVKSGAKLGDKPTEISREAGGAFTLYGGYITGRQIELVPNQQIVQAWRTGGWDPGYLFDCQVRTHRTRLRHQTRLRPHRLSGKPGGTLGNGMED